MVSNLLMFTIAFIVFQIEHVKSENGSNSSNINLTVTSTPVSIGPATITNKQSELFNTSTIISLRDTEDAILTVPQIIRKYGYPIEIHEVITADGYILNIHRIPHGRSCGPILGKVKTAVWLQHGLFGDSSNWIISGPKRGLGYLLADSCYDVWIGNARGNTFSKGHVNLSTNEDAYWQFSWHEMGIYDLPASFDHVLHHTQQTDLFYIGHSMGTTMFWVCMSERPQYNSKIRLMSALAPIAYVEHMLSPIRLLAPFSTSIQVILDLLGPGEFLPSTALITTLGLTLCNEQSLAQVLCTNIVFLMGGYNADQLDPTTMPAILGHTPAGTSVKTVVHYAQEVRSGKFRKFDYGVRINWQIYGTTEPPEYDISKIQAPVAIYWGENDWLAVRSDVASLAERLPNLVRKYHCYNFNHYDFLWAKDSNSLINEPLMTFQRSFQPDKVFQH